MGFANLSGQLLASFGEMIANFFSALLGLIGRGFYTLTVCALGRVCDICQLLFRKFVGLDSVVYDNQVVEGDLVLRFINDPVIQNVFWALLIVAVLMLFIATFAAVIKTEFNDKGDNNKRVVIKNAFRAIVNFLTVPVVCIFGLIVGNALLRAIDGATNINNQKNTPTRLSSQVFVVGGYNANRVRKDAKYTFNNGKLSAVVYVEGSFGSGLVGNNVQGSDGYANFNIFYDDIQKSNGLTAAEKIDNAFMESLVIKGSDLSGNQGVFNWDNHPGVWGFLNDDLSSLTNIGSEDSIRFDIYNTSLVYYYYDLGFMSFDYISGLFALIICAYVFLITVLGLIKRLIMLIILFVISPPICAIYPLDGGTALKEWRKKFIGQALSGYAAVVVMNLFFTLLPMLMKINLFTDNDVTHNMAIQFLTADGANLQYLNQFSRSLIIIAALLFVRESIALLSNIIGADDATKSGADNAKSMTKNLTRAAAGAALTAGVGVTAAKVAGKAVIGAGKGVANFAKDAKKYGFNRASNMRWESAKDKLLGEKDENGKRHTVKRMLKAPEKVLHGLHKGANYIENAFRSVTNPKGSFADSLSNAYRLGAGKKDKGDKTNRMTGNEVYDYLEEDYKDRKTKMGQHKDNLAESKKGNKKDYKARKKDIQKDVKSGKISKEDAKDMIDDAKTEQKQKNKQAQNKYKVNKYIEKQRHNRLVKNKDNILQEKIDKAKDDQAKTDANKNAGK